MRKLLGLLFIVVLISCGKEDDVVEVILREPIIPENAENVSLRPTFGFGSAYGNIQTTYSIYCDTSSTPKTHVGSSSNFINIMSNESVLLKPNTTYYWYCEAEKKGKLFPTDIYSFTTIDTAIIRNSSFSTKYVLPLSDYEEQRAQDYGSYALASDTGYFYSEPISITISGNEIIDAYRHGDYNRALPRQGVFEFNLNKVTILDWKYEFVNFGVLYYASNNNNANKVALVLKQPYSDNVVVFEENELEW